MSWRVRVPCWHAKTRRKCSMEIIRNSSKVNIGNKGIKLVESLIKIE